MNAASESPTTPTEPVSRSSKFVLACFLFFFLIIGAIAVGDLIGAMIR